jgi:hypothetical protein
MKKLLTIALAAVAFVSLLPAAQAGKPKQTVEGSILFPAPFAQGTFDGCWGGLTRRTTGMTGGAVNGVTGYYFDVDKATWNKKFKLEVTGGEGTVDLDLFLYSHYPDAAETADDPVNGGIPVSVDYQTREAGGESGKVPPNTVKAIVCMYAGPEYQGFNAGFTFTAG